MKQFGTIFKFEMKYYLKNKVFVGITVFLMLLVAVVMFLPQLLGIFQPKEEESLSGNDAAMIIKIEDEAMKEAAEAAFVSAFPDYNISITEEDTDAIKEAVRSETAECAFVIEDVDSYVYYVNNLSIYDENKMIMEEIMQKLYQMNVMAQNGMTQEAVADAMNAQVNGTVESLGVDQSQNYWYTYIMIFALYMVILLYGQMVATNVATEKSSRAMEVLITSAKPTSMMFGKVLASCLAGLLQLLAIFGSAILFYNLNKEQWGDNWIIDSIFDMPPELLGYMLLFFVLGFLIYAFMFGAVGSTASKLEDINTSVMPITMMFVIGFLIVMFSFASGDVDNLIMRICSYVPFTSSMAMFTRIAMSTVPWYEIVISIAILIGSTVAVGVVSAKIYRVGVLLYGTTPKIGSILKSIRKA